MAAWDPIAAIVIQLRVVAFFWWTERGLYRWIVIEERQEDRYAFYNGGPQLGLDAVPVVIEPAPDCFELLSFAGQIRSGYGSIAARLNDDGIRNVILIEMAQQYNSLHLIVEASQSNPNFTSSRCRAMFSAPGTSPESGRVARRP